MSNYALYLVKVTLLVVQSPFIVFYSAIVYLSGKSTDKAMNLKVHLVKLILRLMGNIAADTNITRLAPASDLPNTLKRIPKNQPEFSEASDFGTVCSVLPTGQKVYWINKHPNLQLDDPVILYYHGGSLFKQATTQHVTYLLAIVKALRDAEPDSRVSLAFVDYTLLPKKSFPVPLQDSIDAYDDLTIHQGFKNVILSGDSAGALLVVTLMAARKRSTIAGLQPPKSKVEPKGLVLLFPWFSSQGSDDAGSYKKYKNADMLCNKTIRYWADIYSNHSKELFETPWINPNAGSHEFWKGVVPRERTFVSYGSAEILADDAQKWIQLVDIPQDHVFVDPNGCHASLILDFSLVKGYKRFALPSFVKIVSFYRSLISRSVRTAENLVGAGATQN